MSFVLCGKRRLIFGGEVMKRIFSFVIFILCLIGLCGCSSSVSDYALTIDGNRISRGEYMVYLHEQKKSFEERGGVDIWEADFDGTSAEEVAKQNAINSLTLVKAAVAQADGLNVELDDEDRSEIAAESSELYNDIGQDKAENMGVTEEDINGIVEESHIQQKVYDLVTEGVEINEADFEAYFQEHYNSEISRYNDIMIKQIYFPSDTEDSTVHYDEAVAAMGEINAGVDFDEVQEKYSQSESKDPYLLEDGMYDDVIEDELYHLPEGGVSGVLEGADGYYIFKVVSIDAADMDAVREGLRAEYVREKKMEIYQAQNEQWQSGMTVEKNDVVYNEISIMDC